MSTNDSVTSPPLTVNVVLPPPSQAESEHRAFQRLLPQLLQSDRGLYVAVHNGQVVDRDADDIALILRVHQRIGYVPIHVGLVTDEPPPAVRIPHYRILRPESST